MTDDEFAAALTPRLMNMRIIVVAMCMGALMFLGIALLQNLSGAMGRSPEPILTYLAVFGPAAQFLLHFPVMSIIVNIGRKKIARGQWGAGRRPLDVNVAPPLPGDYGPLCTLYYIRLIVGAAMIEGPIFFALVAFLVGGEPICLMVAGALLVALLVKFPTSAGLGRWLEEQQELLTVERG